MEGIEFRQRAFHALTGKYGPWTAWKPCTHMGVLAEHIPPLLLGPTTSIVRVAWKSDYGAVFEYRKIMFD